MTIPEPAKKKYVSTPRIMENIKFSVETPIRVFNNPITTVRLPIRQFMGRRISITSLNFIRVKN